MAEENNAKTTAPETAAKESSAAKPARATTRKAPAKSTATKTAAVKEDPKNTPNPGKTDGEGSNTNARKGSDPDTQTKPIREGGSAEKPATTTTASRSARAAKPAAAVAKTTATKTSAAPTAAAKSPATKAAVTATAKPAVKTTTAAKPTATKAASAKPAATKASAAKPATAKTTAAKPAASASKPAASASAKPAATKALATKPAAAKATPSSAKPVAKAAPAKATTPTKAEESKIENSRLNEEQVSENSNIERPKILIVEDNDEFRYYLKENLKERYIIVEASNGRDGWKEALFHHPELIVSDISMPFMSGIELTNKIKSDKRTNHTPVILLTAITGEEDILRGLETGANDYIAKPVNFDILNAKISNLLMSNKQLKEVYSKQINVVTPEIKREILK